jgi:hypothetical protein
MIFMMVMIFMMSVYHNHHTNHSNHCQKINRIFTLVKFFDYCQRKKLRWQRCLHLDKRS